MIEFVLGVILGVIFGVFITSTFVIISKCRDDK